MPAGVRHAQEGIAGMAGRFNSIAAAALALAMGFQSLAAEREASEMRRMATQAYDAGDIDTAVAAFGDCARASSSCAPSTEATRQRMPSSARCMPRAKAFQSIAAWRSTT
jgi:hypothetical protein